jgi:hypothetical protein
MFSKVIEDEGIELIFKCHAQVLVTSYSQQGYLVRRSLPNLEPEIAESELDYLNERMSLRVFRTQNNA